MKQLWRACLWVAVGVPQTTLAYYSTLDTGELLERDNYRVSLESQFVTDNDSGVNVVGRFDSWLSRDANVRGIVGVGTTEFQVGGFYKWIPYPDIEGQPAIGLLAGVLYARTEDLNDISLRVHPLVSKKFSTDIGDLTPYASIPIGLRSLDGETDVPVQAVLGAELKTLTFEKIRFMAEIGFDVNDAFTYVSLGATLQFDEENGMQWR